MVVNSVHWFRKGLRLHDNPALQEALDGADTVRFVYILDPWFARSANVGLNRWRFLLESLEDLDTSLRKLNSRLFVIRGQPTDVFPRLFKVGIKFVAGNGKVTYDFMRAGIEIDMYSKLAAYI